jgi:transposase
MGGLDVDRGWCEATVVDWFGNVVDSRRVSRDEVVSFLSRMNVSLVAMESSGYVYLMFRALMGGGMHVLVAQPKIA